MPPRRSTISTRSSRRSALPENRAGRSHFSFRLTAAVTSACGAAALSSACRDCRSSSEAEVTGGASARRVCDGASRALRVDCQPIAQYEQQGSQLFALVVVEGSEQRVLSLPLRAGRAHQPFLA